MHHLLGVYCQNPNLFLGVFCGCYGPSPLFIVMFWTLLQTHNKTYSYVVQVPETYLGPTGRAL